MGSQNFAVNKTVTYGISKFCCQQDCNLRDLKILHHATELHHDIRIPVATAWHVLAFWMEEMASRYGG